MREENRQNKLVSRVLRRSEPKRDEVTEEWRGLPDEELYGFYYRVIQNDCRGFNNLSYTIHFR